MAIDFTVMEIFHYALRRDLVSLNADFDRDRWRNFAFQLHFHHTAEDRLLWPVVREKVTDPADVGLVDAMEAEHAQIDPLLAAVEDASTAGDGVAPVMAALTTAVASHLDHEERAALPMMDRLLTPQEWDGFVQGTRALDGDLKQNLPVFMPWLLDGAPDELRNRMLANLPPPIRALFT